MKLVIFPAVEEERFRRIARAVTGEVVNAAGEEEALCAIDEADAFFGKISPRLLDVARRLRWIQSPTASLEHFIFPELVRHPSTLTNMRGIFSDVITDHVIGYILSFARNLHIYARRQAEHRWEPVGGEAARAGFESGPGRVSALDLATIHLPGKALGIVGFGSIGREVGRRAVAFGLEVLATDPRARELSERRQTAGEPEEVWPPGRLEELLGASDFVCIAAPHTPETYKLFRRPQFRRMKASAYLINIGRGVIVDLADLVSALEANEIAGAALDVFEEEPLPADHPLWAMENVIITPHVAGCSPVLAERHLGVLLENIERFQAGRPLLNVVGKERWY